MKIIDLEQRTPAWLAWRTQGIGSSDAAAILGLSPWKARADLLLEKVEALKGNDIEDRPNGAMLRGRNLEPFIAEWYEKTFSRKAPAMCAERDGHPFIRASFDGLDLGGRVAVEIKAPRREDHEEALAGRVPEKYLPQCHHQLLVGGLGLEALHYVSYGHPKSFAPRKQYAVVVVRPDPEVLDSLLEFEVEFWDEVERLAGVSGTSRIA